MRMSVGDEYISTATTTGKWVVSHVECPPKPDRAQNVYRQDFDVEDLFIVRKCEGSCKNLWTFKRGRIITPTCPSCGGDWRRGDPDQVGWAA